MLKSGTRAVDRFFLILLRVISINVARALGQGHSYASPEIKTNLNASSGLRISMIFIKMCLFLSYNNVGDVVSYMIKIGTSTISNPTRSAPSVLSHVLSR